MTMTATTMSGDDDCDINENDENNDDDCERE